jgi:hypothetical protein
MNKKEMAFEAARNAFCKSMKWNIKKLSDIQEAQATAYAHAMVLSNGDQDLSVSIVLDLMQNGQLLKAIEKTEKKLSEIFVN